MCFSLHSEMMRFKKRTSGIIIIIITTFVLGAVTHSNRIDMTCKEYQQPLKVGY